MSAARRIGGAIVFWLSLLLMAVLAIPICLLSVPILIIWKAANKLLARIEEP